MHAKGKVSDFGMMGLSGPLALSGGLGLEF